MQGKAFFNTKKTKVLSSYIKKLIREGEHQQLDFKYAISDSKKIARSLVAFANTDGGKLLIGVKDNGAIAGVRSDEEFYMVEGAAQMYSRPEIYFESHRWEVDGKTVLEITVPKSGQKPHYAPGKNDKWRVYIRVKDQNLLANRVLLKVWEKQKKSDAVFIRYKEPERVLLAFLKENQTITLSKFCRVAYIGRRKAENILINMILLDIVEPVFTEKQNFYRLKKMPEHNQTPMAE